MEESLKMNVLSNRVDEITAREKVMSDLRNLNLGQRTTKVFCEKELGYSPQETRHILAQLGLILTTEQMKSTDPVVNKNIGRLRDWRSLRARREGVPAYRVLSNRAIMALAEDCPKTESRLLEVKGFGEKTARAYGAELIQLLCC